MSAAPDLRHTLLFVDSRKFSLFTYSYGHFILSSFDKLSRKRNSNLQFDVHT